MIKLLELYRYLRCFAIIKISGGFPERFLNLCNRENIYLWDTLYENGAITAKIYCKDFYKLRKIRSKSGVRIKILRKNGLKFSLKHNSKHKILIYGLAMSVISMSIMNLFVWCIDVSNSQSISRYEILSTVETLGLRFGTFVPLFEENKTNREAVNYFDGKVIWAATNIKGSKANLEVREHVSEKNDETTENDPCNIIADFDGIIVSSEVHSGVKVVSQGSAVKNGDLLVSGISENSDGSVNFHSADGRITAYNKRKASSKTKKKKNVMQLQENKRSITLDIFTLHIPISSLIYSKNNDVIKYTQLINIDNSILPFGYSVKTSIKRKSEHLNENSIIFHIDEFTAKEYSSFKNTLILSSNYNVITEKDGYSIEAEYDCIDFIGKKIAIFQEN